MKMMKIEDACDVKLQTLSTKFTCIPNTIALGNGTEKQDDAQNGGARWVELGFFSEGG